VHKQGVRPQAGYPAGFLPGNLPIDQHIGNPIHPGCQEFDGRLNSVIRPRIKNKRPPSPDNITTFTLIIPVAIKVAGFIRYCMASPHLDPGGLLVVSPVRFHQTGRVEITRIDPQLDGELSSFFNHRTLKQPAPPGRTGNLATSRTTGQKKQVIRQ